MREKGSLSVCLSGSEETWIIYVFEFDLMNHFKSLFQVN